MSTRSDEDPLALRSALLVRLFTRYLRHYAGRNFHAVRVSRSGLPEAPAGGPLIVYSNHPSWWDPAFFFILGGAFFRERSGFGPMDADQLVRYGILRRLGVFGIEPGTGGAARFLRVGMRIMAEPRAMIYITAEGTFTDPRARPLRLRSGLAHLARRTPGAVILPLALEYTFWNERKPEALARFGPPIAAEPGGSVADWITRLEAELAACMDVLAIESQARDPALFVTLRRGRSGVGGMYDISRRARAMLAGRRFDPSHQGDEG